MAGGRTVRRAARDAARRLAVAGIEDATSEADLLLARLLGVDRAILVARGDDALAPELDERYADQVRRRAGREPFQYIVGEQEFYGRGFAVDARVLVPRPETEGVVETALSVLAAGPRRVVDLGTGSGCIAVTLAAERGDLDVFALDVSGGALEVARENARRHGVSDRISFVRANMAEPPAEWRGTMDLVVSNPPYVSFAEWQRLAPEVRDHEPRDALVPGESGLEAYLQAAPAIRSLLRDGGRAVLELGLGRRDGACLALEEAGMTVLEVRADLRGIPRVVVAGAPGGGEERR